MTRRWSRYIAWGRTLFYRLQLDKIRAWFERVWYCHHNARVIADFEHRMACVLTTCTDSMSKPYYTIEAMQCEIEAYVQKKYDEGYADGQEDLRAEIEGNAP